ncbi:type VI secretion protein [Streptomyces sp. NPDC005898]|uniref:type VI secretion protein n=1 Tax=Streptomyces sp. NPDC005898 TaxID=3157082 RepID=UPI0033C92957
MRDDWERGRRGAGAERGVPDGLLLGILGFLLISTVLVWSATRLAAWFARGAVPDGVTFGRTPLAVRHLIGHPQDLPGAWPDTPPPQLSGYGLFWGLFIGQLLALLVLTIFTLGTVTRWRAVRRATRARHGSESPSGRPMDITEDTPGRTAPATPDVRRPGHAEGAVGPGGPVRADGWQPGAEVPLGPNGPVRAGGWETSAEGAPGSHGPATAGAWQPGAEGAPGTYGPVRAGGWETGAEGAPEPHEPPRPTGREPRTEAASPITPTPPTPFEGPGTKIPVTPLAGPHTKTPPTPLAGPLILGTPETRRPHALQAIQDAEAAALVLTSDPTLWEETKDARAKLGPVLLYDPSHLCDTPARMHWSPTSGCQDKATATRRAVALLAPIRPAARLDAAVADTAELLMRSFLHAAAVADKPMRNVHRWSQGTQVQEAVRILRTHPKAAPGAAGELEAALTAYPERRDVAQELTARALSALFTVHVRESCTPNRTDALTLDSFVREGGTLFVVGEAIEDPKSRQGPGAMPLLTALASSVVEHGRRMAERSSSGRLDPPMTLVLDDAAAVAPLPQLPELLTSGTDLGMPTRVLLRSREQARSRWPDSALPL